MNNNNRLISLDALKGFIMVVIAIDHCAYFVARVHPYEYWGIVLPQYHGILPFLTRSITHICAPGFFFLMGIGIILFAENRRQKGWSEKQIIKHFALRGLLLICVQLFIENPAWFIGLKTSNVSYNLSRIPGGNGQVFLFFGVLFGLGAAMMVCSLLLRSKRLLLLLIGIVCILGSQVLLPGAENVKILYSPLLRLLLVAGQTHFFQVTYPLIPWLGIAVLGMFFAKELLRNRESARKKIFISGSLFLVLFFVIRTIGGFGSTHSPQPGWIGFFNVTKYPPSLVFILITLGINLLLLFVLEKINLGKIAKPLLTFGRTAFFFYILHLYLYAIIGILFPNGVKILWMYPIWAVGLFILYPLCR
ncbi:DUF1624 domain-containing protein [Acidobacteriota bacterium]